jgi:hypothetical protein
MVVAEETASLGGTSQAKAASRKAASGSAARADGKTVDAAHVHAPEQQAAARGPPRSKSSITSEAAGGKHAYARSRLSELEQKRGAMVGAGQGAPGGGRNPFELPPVITDTFGRNAEVRGSPMASSSSQIGPLGNGPQPHGAVNATFESYSVRICAATPSHTTPTPLWPKCWGVIHRPCSAAQRSRITHVACPP